VPSVVKTRRTTPRHRGLLGVALVILVPLSAGWVLHSLNNYAEGRQQAALHLETLANDINGIGLDVGWAVARHASRAEVEPDLRSGEARVAADIVSLRADDGSGLRLTQVAQNAAAFTEAVLANLRYLDAGGLDPTNPVSTAANKHAADLHDAVIVLIRDQMVVATHQAATAEWFVDAGTWFVVIGMAAVLVLGLWRIEARRRRVAVARARQASIEESEHTFRILFEQNPLPMWTFDPTSLRFLSVNAAAVAGYGYSRDEFLSMTVPDIHAQEGADRLAGTEVPYPCQLMEASARHVLKDGGVIDVDILADELRTGGAPVRLVAARDVTDQRRLEHELRDRAFHDSLTGLANRALFADRFEHAQSRRMRVSTGLAVILIDLDGFKVVNDTLSHAMGDELLRGVAARLQGAVRPQDTVARMGGDEFAILLEDADMAAALAMATRLLDALSAPILVNESSVEVTASAGVAPVRDAHITWDTALQHADLAMYVAKADGKARFRVYEPGMNSAVLKRLEIGSELPRALARGEMSLHYQPVVSMGLVGGRRVEKVEALVRWNHPTRGLMSPGEFIAIAEESGAIVPLGAWVLRTACTQLVAWRAAGRELMVSVNVSGRQLREPGFVETVAEVLRSTGARPCDVTLEVTETALLEDLTLAKRTLNELRATGLSVSLDDFGAGYSSLTYLSELPVDEVKIDRSFIASLEDADKRATVLTIVRLLETMSVRTVAEGVETPLQLAYVDSLGIDACQGFLFCPPLPAADLPAGLERCEADVVSVPSVAGAAAAA
jgi:diguanylate cyclase (GGDEF)-like protein/PAS domain S-box-containing protein